MTNGSTRTNVSGYRTCRLPRGTAVAGTSLRNRAMSYSSMSTRTCSVSMLPRITSGWFGGVPTYSPGRTFTWSTSPATSARTTSRSSSISALATSASALEMPSRATSRSYCHEPALSRSRSACDLSSAAWAPANASRRVISSCSVMTLRANISSVRLSASASRITAARASLTWATMTGIFSLRGSASSRISSLFACETIARFTASSPCSCRSSSRKSGWPAFTSSPTFTSTCTTTPGVAEPTEIFSVWASTIPAAARVAA